MTSASWNVPNPAASALCVTTGNAVGVQRLSASADSLSPVLPPLEQSPRSPTVRVASAAIAPRTRTSTVLGHEVGGVGYYASQRAGDNGAMNQAYKDACGG